MKYLAAVCAILVLAWLFDLRGPTARAGSTQGATSYTVSVSLDGSRNEIEFARRTEVLAVRDVLSAALSSVKSPEAAPAAAFEALQAAYPGLVEVDAGALYYVWRWCEEEKRWILVCCDPQTIRVNLTLAVAVDIELRTDLGP